jgi:ankyrin repeat protein
MARTGCDGCCWSDAAALCGSAVVGGSGGQVDAIKLLAQLGADKDPRDSARATARCTMHYAASAGQVESIDVLAQLDAQVDAQDDAGDTPLQTSSKLGQHQAAQVLRELERTARALKAAATSASVHSRRAAGV